MLKSNDGHTTLQVPADHVLAFYGLHPKLGPVADWGLEMEKKALKVNTENFQTSVPGIFAIGDINTYPGKKKLILSGFHEAALAAFGIQHHLYPQKRQFLQYTTTSPIMQKRLGVARCGAIRIDAGMNRLLEDLLKVMTLERLELDLFRGESRDIGSPQVFGGQVLGQALMAATATVGGPRRALAARLFPAPRRLQFAHRLRGRSGARRQSLLHAARGRHSARRADLQPVRLVPIRRGGARSPAADAAGAAAGGPWPTLETHLKGVLADAAAGHAPGAGAKTSIRVSPGGAAVLSQRRDRWRRVQSRLVSRRRSAPRR